MSNILRCPICNEYAKCIDEYNQLYNLCCNDFLNEGCKSKFDHSLFSSISNDNSYFTLFKKINNKRLQVSSSCYIMGSLTSVFTNFYIYDPITLERNNLITVNHLMTVAEAFQKLCAVEGLLSFV